MTIRQLLKCAGILVGGIAIVWPAIGQFRSGQEVTDLSNLRVVSTAAMIYTLDFDAQLPMHYQNIRGGVCLPNDPSRCGYRSMWQRNVGAYLPNWSVWTSPADQPYGDPLYDYFNLSYGYNYGYLSTVCYRGGGGYRDCPAFDPGMPEATQFCLSTSLSAINNPYRIVFIADSGGKDLKTPSALGSAINPPDATASEKFFYMGDAKGWGKDCHNLFSTFHGGVKTGRWANTDGFAPRFHGEGHATFLDTHAEPLRTPAQMASGTNWQQSIDCRAVLVTDYKFYRWDPRYDDGPQR